MLLQGRWEGPPPCRPHAGSWQDKQWDQRGGAGGGRLQASRSLWAGFVQNSAQECSMGSHHAELGARGELQQQRALGNLLSVLCSTCGHTDFPFFSRCWRPCSVALSVKEARGTLLGKLWVLGCVSPELRPREPLRALPSSEPDPLQCPQPALRVLPCV